MRHAFLVAAVLASGLARAGGGSLTVDAIALDAPPGIVELKVRGSGDLDGDARADEGVLRLECAAQTPLARFYAHEAGGAPGAGQKAKPVRRKGKEWGPMTPQFRMAGIAYVSASADADGDGGRPVVLQDAATLCSAMRAEAARINTSRSHLEGR